MSSVRIVLLLVAVSAAMAAPRPQMAALEARSHHQEAGLEHTEPSTEASGAGESGPDIDVSVSSSTSMKITTMTSSVSSELGPLPDSEEVKALKESEEDVTSNEIDDDVSRSAGAEVNEEDIKSDDEKEVKTEVEAQTAHAGDVVDATSPTTDPSPVDVATSVSMMMTEMTMSVSSEVGAIPHVDADDTPATESSAAASNDSSPEGESSNEEEEQEGSGENNSRSYPSAESEASGYTSASADEASDVDGSGAEEILAVGDDNESSGEEKDSTTKGTLIFDLGPAATPELHDLVQQTVLDALMDEGLLASADVTPVFQVEGSGVVFSDDVEGSAAEQDGSGDSEDISVASSSPYVSIHF